MSKRIATKYASRLAAAKALATILGYKITPGRVYPTYEALADALNLPEDGTIPFEMRVRIEDYLLPPLEQDKELPDL